MSWLEKLYVTFENCADIAGVESAGKIILLPACHTTINAHITVTLDGDGNFIYAKNVSKDDALTIIPCTEDSASRSGRIPPPHPLCDKLQYLAGDYTQFGEDKGDDFYETYIKQLNQWCDSKYTNQKLNSIRTYLRKRCLIKDLIKNKILPVSEDGLPLRTWDGAKDVAPEIFSTLKDPLGAVVRFAVNIPNDMENRVWMDREIHKLFIEYSLSILEQKELCYVTGEIITPIKKHPKKIINTAANAKLISSNDSSGFTYRGRFIEPDQAVNIGFETSFKAHNALQWLINKQGINYDSNVIVAWGTGKEDIPQPCCDTIDILYEDEELKTQVELLMEKDILTKQIWAKLLEQALRGYRCNLKHNSTIVIMGLYPATDGRLSITYYRELLGNEYIENIEKWHSTCIWLHRYKLDLDKKPIPFLGTPSSKDIAIAAYGQNITKNRLNNTLERMLSCIFDGISVPKELVDALNHRASNPMAFLPQNKWEWNKILSIACALNNKFFEKEKFDVALDENRTDRDYLYGRLLAVAERMEKATFDKNADKGRVTNAMRYMSAFSQNPFRTWAVIEDRLRPYEAKLGNFVGYIYKDIITGIISKFRDGDFENDRCLDGRYLLGYHCQRQKFIDDAIEAKNKRDLTSKNLLETESNNE
jgi:CRISPR-associated protein Csd1